MRAVGDVARKQYGHVDAVTVQMMSACATAAGTSGALRAHSCSSRSTRQGKRRRPGRVAPPDRDPRERANMADRGNVLPRLLAGTQHGQLVRVPIRQGVGRDGRCAHPVRMAVTSPPSITAVGAPVVRSKMTITP